MRVKQGFPIEDLAVRFKVSPSTVSRVFLTWANFLYFMLGQIPIWPTKVQVKANLPDCFKLTYPNTCVILDCTEIKVQTLSSKVLLARFAHAAQVYEEGQADLDIIASLLTEADRNFPCQYVDLNAGASYSGGPGRPRMEISREQLEYLVENDISIPDIAQVLGVSVSTVKKRLREFGISSTESKTPISDTELDAAVQGIQQMFPNPGYRRVQSQLFLNGIKVAQRRVRETMHR